MKITNICTPRYITEDHSVIALSVDIDSTNPPLKQIQFNASKHDTEDHGVELYIRALSGEFGEIIPYKEVKSCPDISGFLKHLCRTLTASEYNFLLTKYPAMEHLLREELWDGVAELFIDGFFRNVLSANIYLIVKQSFASYHIPIKLP